MLEIEPFPSAHPCLTLFEREARSMSEKQHPESSARDGLKLEHRDKLARTPHEVKERKYGRSSAEDPTISPTKSDKHVPSNTRNHPRAELKPSGSTHSASRSKHASNHVQNHISGKPPESDGKRKRSSEDDDENAWTEHVSSSGRTYYYNKKLDKSLWERPKGCVKKLKQDSTPTSSQKAKASSSSAASLSKPTPSSTDKSTPSKYTPSRHPPSSSSSHPHTHSHTPSAHLHTGAVRHGGTKESPHKSHLPRLHRDKERERSHASHRPHHHYPHKRSPHSRSHSKSLSPVTASRGSGGKLSPVTASRSGRGKLSPVTASTGGGGKLSPVTASRGGGGKLSPVTASRGGGGKHSCERSMDKTPSRHARTATSQCTPKSAQGSVVTSPLTPVGVMKTSMISPTATSIPATPSTTQRIIEQTSLLLEHHQNVLGGDTAIPVQSPTPGMMHHFSQPFTSPGSTHTHARKELIFSHPPSNGPYNQDSAGNTPITPVVGYPTAIAGVTMTSPQSSIMDNMGLHPLQKALLLQNQFSQQQQTQTQVVLDPSTQPNALLTRTPQMPVASPFPPHLTTQPSHPGSPLPQSPILNPSQPMHVYPPQTPVQQPIPYAVTPGSGPYLTNTSPGIGVNPGFVAITSPTFQTPMSRLGYHNREGSHYSEFPDSNSLEPLPQSQTNPDLFSRSLAESWAQSHEGLLKQIDVCSQESLRRQTVECVHISGKLARTWLSVEGSRVKTTSKDERIRSLRRLSADIEKR